MNLSVLITSTGNKALLIKYIRKCLVYTKNKSKIITIDIDDYNITSHLSDKHYICPRIGDEKYLEVIDNIIKNEDINIIIPTREEDVRFYAEIKNIYKDILIATCDIDSVLICQNKKLFLDFCLNNNFTIPKTYKILDQLILPCFKKPIYGAASKNIGIVNNIEEIDFDNYIYQEIITLPEYTIDYLGDKNGNFINCSIRKRIKVQNGESIISEIISNELIKNEIIRLGNSIKLKFHNNIQLFYDENNDNIYFIEINNRFGGCSNLSVSSGLKSFEYIISVLIDDKSFYNDTIKNNTVYKYTNDLILESEIKNKIFVIDIDGTIVTETNGDYASCQPFDKIIKKVNKLYDNENTIILFTSRGVKSGFNWRPLTEQQLKTFGVKYHSLLFGKPYGDYYIDNKAINVFDWV